MALPSRFLEKKLVTDEKGDDITSFDGIEAKNRAVVVHKRDGPHLSEQDPDPHLSEKESWILNPNTHRSNAHRQP
jgi:hypothetical protein